MNFIVYFTSSSYILNFLPFTQDPFSKLIIQYQQSASHNLIITTLHCLIALPCSFHCIAYSLLYIDSSHDDHHIAQCTVGVHSIKCPPRLLTDTLTRCWPNSSPKHGSLIYYLLCFILFHNLHFMNNILWIIRHIARAVIPLSPLPSESVTKFRLSSPVIRVP